jgi:hypothetical protein
MIDSILEVMGLRRKYTVAKWIKTLEDLKSMYRDAHIKQGLENSRLLSVINISGLFVLLAQNQILTIAPGVSTWLVSLLVLSAILSLISGQLGHSASLESCEYLDKFISFEQNLDCFDEEFLSKKFSLAKYLSWASFLSTTVSLILFVIIFSKYLGV